MLNDIGQLLSKQQANDLWKRLESADVKPALAAELELGLLWSLSQVTPLDLHPTLPTNRQPEALCQSLFPSGPAYIEVTAVSDDTFSDKDKMERAASIICNYANELRRGAGKHLHFQFAENSSYESGRYKRTRSISSQFEITPELEKTLRTWLSNPNWPDPRHIRLTADHIDAVVRWENHVHPEGRTFCTMPAIAYDVEDNPVFKRLTRKQSQLSGVPVGTLKCIFLGDADCNILRNLRPINSGLHAVSGEEIIWHFLDKSSVELVVVFSAQSANVSNPIGSPRIWRTTVFDKRKNQTPDEYRLLEAVKNALPKPSYESYQARSLHRQRIFSPQARGQYLGTHMKVEDMNSMKAEIKFSARAFQEFLAGRITIDQFRHSTRALELFESRLKSGCTLSNARLESAGNDEDDDYLVFEFAPDPAASPLKNPK